MSDSIPVFIDFIEKVYNEKSSARKGNGGIVLFGHSLGGAFSLAITAEAQNRLPLLGVSALGCAPIPNSRLLLSDPDPEPSNPRFIVETNPENIRKFMGEVEWLNVEALDPELVVQVFEPGAYHSAHVAHSDTNGMFATQVSSRNFESSHPTSFTIIWSIKFILPSRSRFNTCAPKQRSSGTTRRKVVPFSITSFLNSRTRPKSSPRSCLVVVTIMSSR